jgi:hypothetical protein
MNKPQAIPARARLQQLLAVPERERTEAEWEEINELEIALAPVNRMGAPVEGVRRNGAPPLAGRSRPGGQGPGRKLIKKFRKRGPGRGAA